jgi:hypothetical protein
MEHSRYYTQSVLRKLWTILPNIFEEEKNSLIKELKV